MEIIQLQVTLAIMLRIYFHGASVHVMLNPLVYQVCTTLKYLFRLLPWVEGGAVGHLLLHVVGNMSVLSHEGVTLQPHTAALSSFQSNA